MATLLKVTKLPHLDMVVIKQSGGHFFIAAPDSFIIDRAGFIQLVAAMIKFGFVTKEEIRDLVRQPLREVE